MDLEATISFIFTFQFYVKVYGSGVQSRSQDKFSYGPLLFIFAIVLFLVRMRAWSSSSH